MTLSSKPVTSRMTMAIAFSRQNNAGSPARNT